MGLWHDPYRTRAARFACQDQSHFPAVDLAETAELFRGLLALLAQLMTSHSMPYIRAVMPRFL